MMKTVCLALAGLLILLSGFITKADAGNLGFGIHSGYGKIKFKQESKVLGQDIESDSSQNSFLFGVSAEYTFPGSRNFYTGLTTDWALGLKDRETWKNEGSEFQSGNMRFFGQFYDLRFGYKNSISLHNPSNDILYYRLYVSGGWDGLHFKRDEFVWRGVLVEEGSSEDISLWRTGLGTGFGYKRNKWALDARIAYAYHPASRIKNDSLPWFTFKSEGTCLDMGAGIAHELTKNMNFYAGISYSLIKLDESDVLSRNMLQAVFPESEMEILVGVVNLTYSF